MKRIILVDFDGVIHGYQSGWKGANVATDPPVPGAITFLKELLKHPDMDVCIYSSRSGQEGGIECMMRYLRKHGLTRGEVLEVMFPTDKPPAFLTIDDRCFAFEGAFPSVEWIEDFQPWNKRLTGRRPAGRARLELERCVQLALGAGLATGHADTHVQLMEEVLAQVGEMRQELEGYKAEHRKAEWERALE